MFGAYCLGLNHNVYNVDNNWRVYRPFYAFIRQFVGVKKIICSVVLQSCMIIATFS